jgi:transcriptional regulator with XRE-family HTH domain
MSLTSGETPTTGEVVRVRREELGLTKAELARRAHLTRSSIHEIELDQRARLQERTLRALEDALRLSPGDIPSNGLRMPRTRDDVVGGRTASLRGELELVLSERRYDELLVLIRRVADRLDELEDRLSPT